MLPSITIRLISIFGPAPPTLVELPGTTGGRTNPSAGFWGTKPGKAGRNSLGRSVDSKPPTPRAGHEQKTERAQTNGQVFLVLTINVCRLEEFRYWGFSPTVQKFTLSQLLWNIDGSGRNHPPFYPATCTRLTARYNISGVHRTER